MPVTHAKVSAIADDPASSSAGEVLPSDWNAAHIVSGLTTAEFASPNVSQWTNDSGYLSSVSGDWTGTFDGQQGTYYLARASHTGTQAATTIADGSVSNTEFQYLDGVTSAIQTQLNGKAASLGSDDNYVTDAQLVVIVNTSGTNTGDNATNSQYSGLVSNATHTGDATGATALTLATVNSNVGSFGSSTSIPSFTVNAKGLITAASGNAVIAPAGTLTGATLASNVVTSSLTTIGTLLAGAVPFSLVTGLDADLATFSLPASTTISAFGATLVDDAAASNARTTLGLVIGTDVLAPNGAGTSLTGIPYTITGTANQVVASAGTGNITLSLPQSIATTSDVTFGSVTAATHIGGTGTTSTLTLKTTTGVGTTNADIIFQVGNNGATEAMRILNSGFFGIGTTAPTSKLHVVDTVNTGLLWDVYSALGGSAFKGRRGRGTPAAPLRVNTNDVLGAYNVFGAYAADDVSTAQFAVVGSARFQFFAAENYTSTTTGSYFALFTTPIGSTTVAERIRVSDVGNVKIAGTANRGTTEGTNHLDIFDGTAPVGTLTNGISLYSTAGELRVMDSGGTATLLSPHDDENYWVFDSEDTSTGDKLHIDVEKLLRFVNDHFGLDFIKGNMTKRKLNA